MVVRAAVEVTRRRRRRRIHLHLHLAAVAVTRWTVGLHTRVTAAAVMMAIRRRRGEWGDHLDAVTTTIESDHVAAPRGVAVAVRQ